MSTDVNCFVTFFPPGISPMMRGSIGSHKGAIHSIFEPYQIELEVEALEDLADEKIEARVLDYISKQF